jgi:hypothetical protein
MHCWMNWLLSIKMTDLWNSVVHLTFTCISFMDFFGSDHRPDAARAEDALTLSYGSELIGMQRDWNEELQSCREFPHSTPQERYTCHMCYYLYKVMHVPCCYNVQFLYIVSSSIPYQGGFVAGSCVIELSTK